MRLNQPVMKMIFRFFIVAVAVTSQLCGQTASNAPASILEVLGQQAPNLSSWVLAPLEQSIPDAIRQNLTLLREDLLDEGKTKPIASLDAYRAAHQLCSSILSALDERDKRLSEAGFRVVQASTLTPATNQALAARRNYLMSWPQYQREVQQRNELQRIGELGDRRRVELSLQDLKMAWNRRTELLRADLDSLYAKFRASLRQTGTIPRNLATAKSRSFDSSGPIPTQPNYSQSSTGFTNSLGMKFVPVPGTEVLFSVWDTRVKDYAEYARENKVTPVKPDFEQTAEDPVVNVSWEDSVQFCEWLGKKEGRTYRLPSDLEWSIAVGLKEEDGLTPAERNLKIKGLYPWGTEWPPRKGTGNYHPWLNVDDFENTSPVGSFEPNNHGLYDLGGNVWQWCLDWYDSEHTERVSRGGSWGLRSAASLSASNRAHADPKLKNNNTGFRVVLVVSGD